MPLPGYKVTLVDVPPTISQLAGDIDSMFAIGLATTAVSLVEAWSVDQVVDAIGARASGNPLLYDTVDSFFREGGSHVYVSAAGLTALSADIIALLDNFDDGKGPGQVTAPGITTASIQEAVAAHALNHGRSAVLDGIDTATVASLVTQAGHITGADGDRFSALFAPWDVAPGITAGTTRSIPPSGRICGNIARNAAQGKTPDDAAAGGAGIAKWVSGVTRQWNDADRLTLNNASVNVSKMVRNQVRTYGFRSLADQTSDANWTWFTNSRLIMAIKNRLGIVAENFEFSKLDGRGHTTSRYKTAIVGELLPFWNNDDLYGATPDDAFSVDVGPAVNTDASMSAGELHARVGLRCSGMSEQVFIDIAKVPNTESLSQAFI